MNDLIFIYPCLVEKAKNPGSCTKFAKEGIRLRWIRRPSYRQSINAFMERAKEADAIIIVVSTNTSLGVLHVELFRSTRTKNILERIFPVVLDEAKYCEVYESAEFG